MDVETTAVLRKRWIFGEISDSRFAAALDDLEAIHLDRYAMLPFMRRVYGLRANLMAYDAVNVALAATLGCSLLTNDRRLARAFGPRCVIRLVR